MDWFVFNIWLFMLIVGITLFILSIRYIIWVKERIGISEEKVRTMEKGGAIFLIVYAVVKLLQISL